MQFDFKLEGRGNSSIGSNIQYVLKTPEKPV